jgi:putative DNA methylase
LEESLSYDRRAIEELFPVKEISDESVSEKNVRQGHISTLHIWWARRPLASSRATEYESLVRPIRDQDKRRQFVIALSKWENSLNKDIVNSARKDILEVFGRPPKVLDPFAGGGAIPLESMRLGCETYASDYNPVSVIVLKCTLEYPQKYSLSKGENEYDLISKSKKLSLVSDLEHWANWVLEEARKEIGRFYEADDQSIPVAYIWSKTISCQNPTCSAEIPLLQQFWLCNKEARKIALYPYVQSKELKFKLVGKGHEPFPPGFDPEKGTVSRAVATCPICAFTVDDDTTRNLFSKGKSSQKLLAVVTRSEGHVGKRYRLASNKDLEIFKAAEKYLLLKQSKIAEETGLDPVPDEPMPPIGTLGFRVQRYGIVTWGELFNSRQKLVLITLTDKVKRAHSEMIEKGYDKEQAKVIVTYLALMTSKFATTCNTVCRWNNASESFAGKPDQFGTLEMKWDYPESNLFSGSTGSFSNYVESVLSVKVNSVNSPIPVIVTQGSATNLQYPDNFFDAIFTDPPYYDNIPYSYLSDFFYVWLKRSIGDLYPDLFATPLTPKNEEIVAYSEEIGGFEAGRKSFEEKLGKSFSEINRVLRPKGISVIVYAHKSTAGWESLINSLLDSGLVVTASWPIETERKARMRSQGSAALASSIYMIARKIDREETGFYKEVKNDLKKYLWTKLDNLWNAGISGADFFISAIGSAIQVFGIYDQIIDDEGQSVRADRLLEDVRRIVADYAVRQVLHNGFAAEISQMTRFYVLWRWAYGEAKLDFDDARKLASGVGIDLAQEWNKGLIRKDKEFIEVLGPEDRRAKELEGSKETIDVLHHVLLLWKQGKNEDMIRVLKESGFGKSDVFYRVAQAISETLPNESKEKKLLDGFLAGRQRIVENVRKVSGQSRLFE